MSLINNLQSQYYYNSPPIFQIVISNAFVFLNENNKQLKLSLVEDDEIHYLRHAEVEELKKWYIFLKIHSFNNLEIKMIRMGFLKEVSTRWGAVQKTDLEHELAAMRKQLGQLWEMCTDGTTPPKIQKVKFDKFFSIIINSMTFRGSMI